MTKPFILTPLLVSNVLQVVDKGLVRGVGTPKPGNMCVEAAVCYAMGLPHGDEPTCVSPVIRKFKIRLNDSNWSSPKARSKGMRRLAILQLGTREDFNDVEFAQRLAFKTITTFLPDILRKAGFFDHALACEKALNLKTADAAANAAADAAAKAAADAAAYDAAYAAKAAADAASAAAYAVANAAAYAAADAVADAAAYAAADAAANAAAYDAAYAAKAAADAAANAAAYAAKAAAYAAADAAAYAAAKAAAKAAANAAADAADAAADDAAYAANVANAAADANKPLAHMADIVADILIEMKVPAVKFLYLL